jgi:hypothetical protein
LYVAADRGYTDIVHELLKYGVYTMEHDIHPNLRNFVVSDRFRSPRQIADLNEHVHISQLLRKIGYVQQEALSGNVSFFMREIEGETLVPYIKQWMPYFRPYDRYRLFEWIPQIIKTKILSGPLTSWFEDFFPYLEFEDRVNFFRWISKNYWLQKACLTPSFADMYPNFFGSIVSSFLTYDSAESKNNIEHIYHKHVKETSEVQLRSWSRRTNIFF